MNEIIEWLLMNKYWFLSGIGVAVPIAIAGWWLNKQRSKLGQVQYGGDGSTNIIAGGDVAFHGGNDEKMQRMLNLKNISDFRQVIYKAAYAHEEHMNNANKYGKLGDLEKGKEVLFKAADSQREIVDAYRSNKYLFTNGEKLHIDSELDMAEEEGNEDALLHLIIAIQLINTYSESKLSA